MSKIIEIPLTRGLVSIIDEQDYDLVCKYKWYTREAYNTFYANAKNEYQKTIIMHRVILGLTDRLIQVDHKNRNGLDNTRSNLRIATPAQNTCNRSACKNKTSKFKGVFLDKKNKVWVSQIRPIGGKTMHIGNFKNEIDAALAYNKKAIELHGEWAFINQISPT